MRVVNFKYSKSVDFEKELNKELEEESNYSDILIQIFTGICDTSHIREVIDRVGTLFKSAKIIGSTTDGEIYNSEITTFETIISFSFFKKSKVEQFSIGSCDIDLSSFEVGEYLAKNLIKDDTKVIIAFVDGIETNANDFLDGISSIDSSVVVAGGLAGDNATFNGTYVFNQNQIFKEGVVAISIDSKDLTLYRDYSFGWLPIGKELTITKAIKNRVYMIDNLTAVDTYSKYLGDSIAKKLPAIGIEFPLILKTKDYTMARAVLKIHSDGSITFAGNIKKGDRVYFGLGDVSSIILNSQKVYKKLNQVPIEGFFIYSCMARRRFLQNSAKVEISALNSLAPVVGFFTYGEFFHISDSKNELFNETTTFLALSESKDSLSKSEIEFAKVEDSDYLNTLKALTHLVNRVSSELKDANEVLEFKTHLIIQQSRFTAMGEMIGNIAHQWRQPLNTLGLLIQKIPIVYSRGDLNEKFIDKFSEKGMRVIDKMSTTIDDFRSFFKPNREKSKFKVEDSIESALYLIEANLNNHSIEYDLDIRENVTLFGYPNELSQVILNIINNSKDAIVEKDVDLGRVSIKAFLDRDSYKIEISDNAGGIDDTILPKIFEPYFTTKEEGKGSGVGLYMSKMVVEKSMRGKISVENLNDGVKFKISLPLSC